MVLPLWEMIGRRAVVIDFPAEAVVDWIGVVQFLRE